MGILNIPLDESDDPELWAITGEICASCGERLLFTDEVFLLQIVQSQAVDGKVEIYPVLDDEGDYFYTPHFIHIECWEGIDEAIRERRRDSPPIPCEGAVLECSVCSSSILPWEKLAISSIGEMHLSDRRPSGQSSTQFINNGHPEPICVACVSDIIIEELELWDSVSQNDECEDCTQQRCWRARHCECDCHFES